MSTSKTQRIRQRQNRKYKPLSEEEILKRAEEKKLYGTKNQYGLTDLTPFEAELLERYKHNRGPVMSL